MMWLHPYLLDVIEHYRGLQGHLALNSHVADEVIKVQRGEVTYHKMFHCRY